MLNNSIHEAPSYPASVTFKSSEGKSIQINKYFLFLYDAFYRSILEECAGESATFIFEGATFDDLILLREKIYKKHLRCGDLIDKSTETVEEGKLQIKEMDELDTSVGEISNEDPIDKTADKISSTANEEDRKLQIKEMDELESSEGKSSADTLTLDCPFKCDEIPHSEWNVDTLFAHIYSNHWNDVKNNFFVSIDNFIDRLSSKLSSTKCALKCDKSRRVYQDLVALKTHYKRCHAEDPVICSNCGENFKNPMTYKGHARNCHSDETKCDLCNNGKIYKNVYAHKVQFHREKRIDCEVQGCKIKFMTNGEQKRHNKIVHKKEKPFLCDKCGIRMAQIANLRDHRVKVHGEGNLTWKDYKDMIRSGQHNFVPKGSEIPAYM